MAPLKPRIWSNGSGNRWTKISCWPINLSTTKAILRPKTSVIITGICSNWGPLGALIALRSDTIGRSSCWYWIINCLPLLWISVGSSSSVWITRVIGSASLLSAHATISTRIIANDSGSLRVICAPSAGTDSIKTIPPICSTAVFTTSIPTPRPEVSLTVDTVENPGWQINCKRS